MCVVKTPKAAEVAAVPERTAARAPDNGDPMVRNADRARRRLSMAAASYAPAGGALGAPAVAGAGGNAVLGV